MERFEIMRFSTWSITITHFILRVYRFKPEILKDRKLKKSIGPNVVIIMNMIGGTALGKVSGCGGNRLALWSAVCGRCRIMWSYNTFSMSSTIPHQTIEFMLVIRGQPASFHKLQHVLKLPVTF